MRSGDPANVTSTPRARSDSATASDGATWPNVPPAAIRHLSGCCMTTGDVKEDPDRDEDHDQARAAVRDKGQRDPRQRREPEHRREVDQRLAADQRDDSGREPL